MKINATTRQILLGELPWMENILPEDAEEYNVQLIDLDLLSRSAGLITVDGFRYTSGQIVLVSGQGEIIGQVGIAIKSVPRRKWSWQKWRFLLVSTEEGTIFKETVEQAIDRLSPSSRNVRFIVEISGLYSASVRIHKIPNRVTDLPTWLMGKRKEEIQRLRTIIG